MMKRLPELLQQLETLRRRLEDVDNKIGSAYDYLDRGLPDEAQIQETWEKIDPWKEEAAQLENKLTQLVAEVRQTEPDVITQWVDLHKTLYKQIKARYEGPDKLAVPNLEIANIFIDSALEKWEQVRIGEKDYVLSIYSFISQHEDIYEKIFSN